MNQLAVAFQMDVRSFIIIPQNIIFAYNKICKSQLSEDILRSNLYANL
jgi:hypothetical protein